MLKWHSCKHHICNSAWQAAFVYSIITECLNNFSVTLSNQPDSLCFYSAMPPDNPDWHLARSGLWIIPNRSAEWTFETFHLRSKTWECISCTMLCGCSVHLLVSLCKCLCVLSQTCETHKVNGSSVHTHTFIWGNILASSAESLTSPSATRLNSN